MKKGATCRARKQQQNNNAASPVVANAHPSPPHQREARSPDPLPSARSGCATSSTTSSLAGTKQWVDDVLSASVKRRDASHPAAFQQEELSRGSTASGGSSIAFFKDKTSADRTTDRSADRLVPPVGNLATSGTSSSSSSDTSSSTSSWDVHSNTGNEGVAHPHPTSPAGPSPHRHRCAYSQRTLRIDELLSLYRLLDADDDGVVSVTDMSAFLALHPQSIDLTVQHFFHARKRGGVVAVEGERHMPANGFRTSTTGGVSTEDSIPILVALSGGDVQLLASCPRSQVRDPVLHQRYAKRRFKVHSIPQAKEVEGPLWWALGRSRVEERAVKFTSFVFHLVASLSSQASAVASASAADVHAARQGHHSGSVSSGGGVAPFISLYHFQLLYYEAVRLLRSDEQSYVLAVLDVPMLQQLMWFFEFLDIFGRASGRWWAASIDEDETPVKPASDDDLKKKRQASEALSMPDVQAAARSFAARMSPDAAESHQQRMLIAPPLGTCLPAVYWTFAAWDLPRSWLDVSLLQRLGEVYLKRKASQHAKLTYQFLRHLWLSQRHTVDRSGTWGSGMVHEQRTCHPLSLTVGGDASQDGRKVGAMRASQKQQQQPWLDGDTAARSAATTATGRRLPSSVAEQIALVQLSNRFLAFHGIRRGGLSPSSGASSSSKSHASSSSDAGDGWATAMDVADRLPGKVRSTRRSTSPAVVSGSSVGIAAPVSQSAVSLVDRVAKKGVAALWETESAASTQASPKRPLVRRNTWRLATAQHREEKRVGVHGSSPADDGAATATETDVATAPVHMAMRTHHQQRQLLHSECDATPELLVDAVVRQSLLAQDVTLHTVLRPDALSLVPSLCERERRWMRRASMWCVVRSAIYALAAAMLIGLADLAAQTWILGSSPSFLDTSDAFSSIKDLFSIGGSSSGGVVLGNATSSPLVASSSAALDNASSTSMSTFIKYQVMVLLATFAVSLGEVIFLYLDTLQLCLQLARCGGIPLDAGQSPAASSSTGDASVASFIGSMSMGSIFSASGAGDGSSGNAIGGAAVVGASGDNGELRLIRQHLLKRRVRFIIAAISKCALQIHFDSTTVFGIDVRNRNVSRLATAVLGLFERLKRVAPSIIVRVLAARVLSRSLVPFVSAPLLLAWNCVLTRSSVDAARLVVLGAISMEKVVPDLLSRTFAAPPRVVARNESLGTSNKGSRRGGGGLSWNGDDSPIHVYASRPLYYVPYHIMREMLMLVLFYAHAVDGAKVVHPSLHCLLVELLSSCELPDVCMWMVPKDRGCGKRDRQQTSTMEKGPSKQQAPGVGGLQGRSSVAPSSFTAYDLDCRVGVDDCPPSGGAAGNGGRPAVAATSFVDASASTVAWSAHLEAMLLDVSGGNGTALSAWLRSFVRELNAMRGACRAISPSAAWLQRYADTCPWPAEIVERAHLAQHIRWAAVLTPSKVCDARMAFLMENAFPSWASPSAMGPCPLHTVAAEMMERHVQHRVVGSHAHVYERGGGDGASSMDEDTASNCSVEMGHTSANDALRSGTLMAPFQTAHIKLFLALGIVVSVATTVGSGWHTSGPSRSISGDPKKRRFLLHLRRAYMSAAANAAGSHAGSSASSSVDAQREKLLAAQRTDQFLHKIDTLHSTYWAGSPALKVSEVMYLIDASCKGAW